MALAASATPAGRAPRRAPRRPAAIASPAIRRAPGPPASAGPVVPSRKVAVLVEPSPFSHVSGMQGRFLRMVEDLTRAGDDVVVFTPDPDPPAEWGGARVVGLSGFCLPGYDTGTLRLSFGLDGRMWAELRRDRPDVIHCSSPGLLVFSAIALSKALDVPLVVSYHTHVPHYIPRYTWAGLVGPMWSVIRACSRAAQLTLVTSHVMQEELRGQGCPRLAVWPRGVDTEAFHPRFQSQHMRRRMAGGREGPVLAYVGRLGAEKNLYALREVASRVPGATVCFVGDGPEREGLEAHFEGCNATFMGLLRGEELASAYASADVFVMPSESETLGFVVLEAMASGTPVVAVAAGGIKDIVTSPGEVGMLYSPGDYEGAAVAVNSLLGDAGLRERVGAGGRAEAERWGWAASNNVLRTELYSRAIRQRQLRRKLGGALERIEHRQRLKGAVEGLLRSQHAIHAVVIALCSCVLLGSPGPAAAAGGAASAGYAWIEAVQGLGSAGPVAMLALVVLGELVPLVPTQPFAIASGLLFGWGTGWALTLAGTTAAAVAAFQLSRTQGLANVEELMAGELGSRGRKGLQSQLGRVQDAVSAGSELERTFKVFLLRLTPVVPFSVSNYLLGLTRLSLASFVAGTTLGMAPWMAFYAFVGSTGRALLASGLTVESAMVSLSEGLASNPYLIYLEGVAVATLAGFLAVRALREARAQDVEP